MQHLPRQHHRVLVAGGGVGALEAALALDSLAPQITTTVLTRSTEYIVRPSAEGDAFADARPERYAIDTVLPARVEHLEENLESVNAIARTAMTDTGTTLPYDALIVACGATPVVPYPYAITLDDRKLHDLLVGTVRDIEARTVRSLAFVAPARPSSPLALYELSLVASERAWGVGAEIDILVVTPEDRPLEAFGKAVSEGMSELLVDAGIEVRTSSVAEVPRRREIICNPGKRRIKVDRVIALPELSGPGVPGLPADEYGFLPVDSYCRVRGAGPVFALGDAANLPVKHGGLAAQMAVTVSRLLAADAGAEIEATPLEPELRGVLLTGRRPRFISARAVGTSAETSVFSDRALWDPPTKVCSTYLEPRLREIDERRRISEGATR